MRSIFKNQYFISFVGLCIIILIAIPVVKNNTKQRKIDREIEGLQNEINSLNGRNNDLKKVVDYLKSDQFVMEQSRLNLNVKKPGEEVYVIEGMGATTSASDQIFDINKAVPGKKEGNPEKWVRYFMAKR